MSKGTVTQQSSRKFCVKEALEPIRAATDIGPSKKVDVSYISMKLLVSKQTECVTQIA